MSTSVKSKREPKRIDQPFEPKIWRKAKEIANQYQMVIWTEGGEFYGRGSELPLVMSGGKNAEECISNVREALTVAVAYMLEVGERPPAPATDQSRTVQLNIRLTAAEKQTLEQESQRQGFRGVSDYVRHAALTHEKN